MRRRGVTVFYVVAAMGCFVISVMDLRRAAAEVHPRVCTETCRLERLWAEKTVSAEIRNATLASAAARACPEHDRLETAKRLWRRLYERMPGDLDTGPGYADMLIRLDKTDEAKRVLEDVLSTRLNPFNPMANCLYARLLTNDPIGRLRCAQRALRFGALNDAVKATLADTLSQSAAMEALEHELPRARALAAAKPDESAAGPTVELLRISAYAKEQAGAMSAAIADQRLAANFYRRLEEEQNPYRRRSEAEVDTFYTLARMLYAFDTADYREAYAAILVAEKYAVLASKHEAVAHPRPEEGFVGGEVVMTELPEGQRALWRLSALLHIVAGDERHLMERVLASMPPEHMTNEEIRRELAGLYRQACTDLTRLPAAERPAHYADICEMARQFKASLSSRPAQS